jgi:hypothetical protein
LFGIFIISGVPVFIFHKALLNAADSTMSWALFAIVGCASESSTQWRSQRPGRAPKYYETGAKWTDFKDDDKIVVHIVPHSHDDVGWNKNVDEYFSGVHNDLRPFNVQLIIDTVTRALIENENRTFTYVEQAFFQRWWMLQNEVMRREVKRIVANGQLNKHF